MLALITALLVACARAYNLGGSLKVYANFTNYPLLDDQWTFATGSSNSSIQAGILQGSNLQPLVIRTNHPYWVGTDAVVQMNAQIQYSAVLGAGSVVSSPTGWNEDPYYGCAWVGAMNWGGWRFQFLITQYKVYALYARYPVSCKHAEEDNALPPRRFAYIIPIAKVNATDVNNYSVNMQAKEFSVSWRINNVEKLLIDNVGQTISGKFLVWSDDTTFIYQPVTFPHAMFMEIGVGSMEQIGAVGQPNTVCEFAVWDMCTQDLMNAPRCFCRYGTQQALGGWEIFQTAVTSNVFIANVTNARTCAIGGPQSDSASRWWTRN